MLLTLNSLFCINQGGSTYQTLNIKRGYFSYPKSEEVYQCHVEKQCTGNKTAPCREGSKGPLCTVCKKNFWKTGKGQCKKCRENGIFVFLLSAGILALFFIVIVIIFSFYDKLCPESLIHKFSYALAKPHALLRKIMSPEIVSRGKIIWTAYQILTATKQTLPDLRFPYAFDLIRTLIDGIVGFSIAELPVACIINSEYNIYGDLLFRTLLPLILFLVVTFALSVYYRWHPKENREITLTFVGLFIAFIALPSVSEAVFSVWDCTKYTIDDDAVGSSKNIIRLSVDHSVACEENVQLFYWRFYSVIMWLSPLGGPLGTPLLCFLLLWVHRDRIRDPPGDTPESKLWYRKHQDKKIAPMKFIYDSYRCEFWW